jgi:hypothetical protein
MKASNNLFGKLIIFSVLAVFLFTIPMVSYGGTSKFCAEADTRETVRTNNPMLASNNDQPCYAGGKYVGNCSRNQPYYNVFSGACYATLQDYKKADGDLSSVQGSGGCVRCGR